MAVLFGHAASMFLPGSALDNKNVAGIGVYIFFLLSGFLISYSVFKKYNDPKYNFSTYFIDRFSRIYCAFLPAIVFVWILDSQILSVPITTPLEQLNDLDWLASFSEKLNFYTGVGNILMMQDFPLFQVARAAGVSDTHLFIDTFGSGRPFWTISIEWWTYMLFGGIVLFHIRNRNPVTILSAIIVGFVAIEPLYHFVGGPFQSLTMLWVLGMLACLLYLNMDRWQFLPKEKMRWYAFTIFLFSLFLMLARAVTIHFDGLSSLLELQFGVYLALTVFSFLLVASKEYKLPTFISKVIRFTANYSYSLYLVHYTVLIHLYVRFPGHEYNLAFFGLAILASNIAAIILWYLFERHYRQVGNWLKERIST